MSEQAEREMELEANEFARCLLIPKSLLEKDIRSYRTYHGQLIEDAVHNLARRYQVTEFMMRYRLVELGYLSPL